MIRILKIIYSFLSRFYSPKLTIKFRIIRKIIYTELYKSNFKCFGRNSYIVPKWKLFIGLSHISIGENTQLGKGIQLTAWEKDLYNTFSPEIVIGNGCSIGDYSHISAINRISIGNNVLTGKFILISDNSHGNFSEEELRVSPAKRPLYSKGPIVIEDNVWIGEKATILANVTIGFGSIIGAGAVVTKSIPPYCIAAGNPARIIKKLYD